MELNEYKRINVQTLQSQVQDSVENEETHEETQGQANHEPREDSAPGFAAHDPSTGPEAPPEEFSLYPYGNHLRTNILYMDSVYLYINGCKCQIPCNYVTEK